MISVDLPAPFWPSRQCTSPARDLEADAVERPDARERLDDAVEAQHDAVRLRRASYATSLASTAAPATPARAPSSESTTGRLPVASGSERR